MSEETFFKQNENLIALWQQVIFIYLEDLQSNNIEKKQQAETYFKDLNNLDIICDLACLSKKKVLKIVNMILKEDKRFIINNLLFYRFENINYFCKTKNDLKKKPTMILLKK